MQKGRRSSGKKMTQGSSLEMTIFRSKHRIKSARVPEAEVIQVSLDAPVAQISDLVKGLANDPAISRYVVGVPFFRNNQPLNEAKRFYLHSDLPKQIFWDANVLALFSNELNAFLVKRKLFEAHTLAGKLEDGEQLLSEIDLDFGRTRWSLENRINTQQTIYGLEYQKDFTVGNRLKLTHPFHRNLTHPVGA